MQNLSTPTRNLSTPTMNLLYPSMPNPAHWLASYDHAEHPYEPSTSHRAQSRPPTPLTTTWNPFTPTYTQLCPIPPATTRETPQHLPVVPLHPSMPNPAANTSYN